MPDRPNPSHPPEDGAGDARSRGRDIGRRQFVKLIGGTGVAVSATGVLGGAVILPEVAEAAAGDFVGPGAVPLTLRVNGKAHRLVLEPRVTLLDALRNHLDLTGAKRVCDRGTCGACTVHRNGHAVYACTVLAIDAAESEAEIHTIESLAPEGHLHPLSAAFVENDGQQCGFCTPGFVMAGKAYLDRHPHPSYDQVKAGLGGNFCRCGTYMGVRRAVVETGGGAGIPPREGDA
jgi:xanthine dehydrogenase YagT iron-sulfur-binding subunit